MGVAGSDQPPLTWTCAHERPAGGCLTKYLPAWKDLTEDPWVLSIIEKGYAPSFQGPRPP